MECILFFFSIALSSQKPQLVKLRLSSVMNACLRMLGGTDCQRLPRGSAGTLGF